MNWALDTQDYKSVAMGDLESTASGVVYLKNLIPHARAMAKPRFEGEISERPAPDGPS